MSIEAIVMAGGKGTRLHPYTAVFPKPLMPLGDKPVLELLLRQLRAHGIRSVCLAVNHLRHLIQAFFGDGSGLDMTIRYSVEDQPLGTAGPIGVLLDEAAEDVLVLNGDLVTTMSFSRLLAHHREREADATIATTRREYRIDSGVLEVDDAGCVRAYREKPVHTYSISMGLYVLRRRAISGLVGAGEPLDMPQLFERMTEKGLHIASYSEPCTWLDIGRPDDYAAAQELVATLQAAP
jgi:NDP-sugar pyrophosphorylase family protein